MMRWFCSMFLALGLISSVAMAQTRPSYEFKFGGNDAAKEWQKTNHTTLEPQADQLSIKGTSWDSKIFRSVELPAGRYCVYGEGSGALEVMIQAADFKSPPVGGLNLSAPDGKWKTDYRDFDLPAGRWVLVLHISAAAGEARIKWLKLETAPDAADTSEVTPSPEELAKYRPNPPLVRGFMIGNNLKAQDYEDLKSWGANVVRVQFGAPNFAGRAKKTLWEAWPSQLDAIENQVILARDHGVKVVLDMHEAMVEHTRNDRDQWTDPNFEGNMIRAWRDIVTRMHKYHDTIWAYELWNEPLDRNQLPWAPRQWRPLAVRIVKEIRTIDPDCWIIYGPGPGSLWRGIDHLRPLPDTHIIYTVHYYSPDSFTHQGVGLELKVGTDMTDLTTKINNHYPGVLRSGGSTALWDRARLEQHLHDVDTFANRWKVPMFVGEFSVIRWAPSPDGAQWLNDVITLFENRGWSWTYHAFREWPGWSLEHPSGPESFWAPGMPHEILSTKATTETDRAKVVKSFLKRNQSSQ